jgi:diguanylate cyclase (GGDEF)-like protein
LPGCAAYLSKPVRRRLLRQGLLAALAQSDRGQLDRTETLPTTTSSSPPLAAATTSNASVGLHILVVDDNTINRMVALGLMNQFGCVADTAADGQEALVKLAQNDYDIVLMDCQMPNMDGYEATRWIRSENSPVLRRDVWVIAMTANAMRGDRELCIAAGMDDYITKPLNRAKLGALIDSTVFEEGGTRHIARHPFDQTPAYDAVTGLAGRQVFVERFILESVRCRSVLPLSLLAIAIHDFPACVEHLGEEGRDESLRTIAGLITAPLRRADLAARYGTGDFYVLLPDTDQTGATILADKLCAAVRSTPLAFGGAPVTLRLDVGIAALVPPNHAELDEMLGRALDALAHATADGGDCVRT